MLRFVRRSRSSNNRDDAARTRLRHLVLAPLPSVYLRGQALSDSAPPL
jgi:hypothetical protein